jgi:hypothetical protein
VQTEPHNIKLVRGYCDGGEVCHREVQFGRQIKAAEYFFFESVWGDKSNTALTAYLVSLSLTRFGSLVLPISSDVLLQLDTSDWQLLTESWNRFIEQNGVPQPIDGHTLKLVFGLVREEQTFNIITLGRATNGHDLVEMEGLNLTGFSAQAFLAGRRVIEISTDDGGARLTGAMDFQSLGELSLVDVVGLSQFSSVWEASLV